MSFKTNWTRLSVAVFQLNADVNVFVRGPLILSNVACEQSLFGALNPILNVKKNDDVEQDFTIPFPTVKVNTVS